MKGIIAFNTVKKYNHLRPFGITTISSFADNGSGGTTVSYTAHGLQNGDMVNIYNTTSYGLAPHKIKNVTSDTFDIDVTFVGAEPGVGRWGNEILEDSHGFVYGKLPSELGLINRSSATDINDFYNTDKFINDGSINILTGEYILGSDFTDTINDSKAFTMAFDIKAVILDYKSINLINLTDGSSTSFMQLDSGANLRFNFNGNQSRFAFPNERKIDDFSTIIFVNKASDFSQFECWIDGKKIESIPGFTVDAGLAGATFGTILRIGALNSNATQNPWYISFVKFYDRAFTEDEKRNSAKQLPKDPTVNLLFKENVGTTLVENLSQNTFNIINPNAERDLFGFGGWLDKKSLLPPLVEYMDSNTQLYLQNSAFVGFDEDFSMFITMKINDNTILNDRFFKMVDKDLSGGQIAISGCSISKVISSGATDPRITFGRQSPRLSYNFADKGTAFAGFTLDDSTILTFCVNKTKVSTEVYTTQVFVNGIDFTDRLVGSDTITDTTSIIDTIAFGENITRLTTNLYQAGVSFTKFTAKEAAEIGQLGLPPTRWQESALVYYQFQSGSIYDDGVAAEPVIRDLTGNGYDLEVFGLTGANKADKITDYRNNFVKNINTNR